MDKNAAPKSDIPNSEEAAKIAAKIPTGSAPEEKFPWRKIGSFSERLSYDPNFVSHIELVKTYVLEKFYSDYYWNAVLILGNCFFAWLLSRWRFGIFGLVFVLLCTSSVYRQEIRRFKRNVRDDILRISATEKLDKNFESMEWLNSFLSKFWVIYMPSLSETVEQIANQTLEDLAPGYGVDKLTLDEFNLGSKAPRIDSIKSYTKKGDDTVEMDWAFSFTPDDVSDMTKREIQKKADPKVSLGVTVGKAFVSKKLPILVEHMNVSGRMKVVMKLSLNFPHIKLVSVQLLEPPKIEFSLKPVGGDTFGLDIMSLIPGLKGLITSIINANVGPMLYAPNHLDIDVEEIMEGSKMECIGVVAITVKSGNGLKSDSVKINPYLEIYTDVQTDKHVRTDVKASTSSPVWNETKYLLVNSLQQNLNFELFDFSLEKKKGTLVASHTFDMNDLLQKDTYLDVKKEFKMAGKNKGLLNYDIRWFPVLTSSKVVNKEETQETEIPDTEVGVFKFTLHQAKDLDISNSLLGKLNPKAELFINDVSVKSYRTLKQSNEPSWEETFEKLVTEKSNSRIKLVISQAGLDGDVAISTFEESLDNIVFNVSDGKDIFEMSPQGKVRITAAWKPVSLSGVSTAANYVQPIGSLRVDVVGVEDVKNLEKIGKVDPYVKVLLNNRLKFQTQYVSDSLDATYNDVFYIPVISRSQQLTLEVMDFQNLTKDRTLGSVNIPLSKFIKRDSNTGQYVGYDGSKDIIKSKLTIKNHEPKGFVYYAISFIPSIPVYTITELEELESKKQKIAEKKEKEAKQMKEWEEQYKKNPNDYEWVEVPDDNDEDLGEAKQKFSLEKLLSFKSGTLAFHILGGVVSRPESYVQMFLDDSGSPCFTSTRALGSKINTEVGDGFVRDLDNSRTIFRIVKKPKYKDEDDIICEDSFPTKELLTKFYNKPSVLKLKKGQLKIRFEYIPTSTELSPSETMADTGIAKIEILDGENMPSHDRNGKSDPFAELWINGIKAYKTEIIKKTLEPKWNETTTLPIKSRTRTKFDLKVFDFDRTGDNDLIAESNVDLSSLQPNTPELLTVQLKPHGSVRLRITFVPEYIRPKVGSNKATPFGALGSLQLGAAGDLASGALGAGAGAIGAGAGLATSAIGAGAGVATGAFGAGAGVATGAVSKGGSLFKSVLGQKKHSRKSIDQSRASAGAGDTSFNDTQSIRSTRTGANSSVYQSSGANGNGNATGQYTPPPTPMSAGHQRTSSTVSSQIPHGTTGSLSIRLGSNLGSHAQLRVSIAHNNKIREIYQTKNVKASNGVIRWDEDVTFNAPPDAKIIFGGVVHHKFAKDQELGNASIDLFEVIDNPRDMKLEIGTGSIVVGFRYHPIEQ